MMEKLECQREDEWRKFVRISGRYSDIDKIIIESEMDKLYEDVPEFQILLSDAASFTKDVRDNKILIRPPSNRERKMNIGPFVSSKGDISLDPHFTRGEIYAGTDGKLHPITLRRTLFHEFSHFADPATQKNFEIKTDKKRLIYSRLIKAALKIPISGFSEFNKQSDILEKEDDEVDSNFLKASLEVVEPYIRRKTNNVMFRYYNEPFRVEQDEQFSSKNSFCGKGVVQLTDKTKDLNYIPLPILDVPDLEHSFPLEVEKNYQEKLDLKGWKERIKEENSSKRNKREL
jgi:hypothetical protein